MYWDTRRAGPKPTNMPEISYVFNARNIYSLSVSLGHATQQQKLQSSPRFGVFKADFPTRFLIQRSVFLQTPVIINVRV